MNLLNIGETIVLYQQEDIVLLNVLIFYHVKITNNNILTFLENKKRRPMFKTMAEIQPLCRANSVSSGYLDGTRVFPRSVTDRNNALFLHNNHFCLVW